MKIYLLPLLSVILAIGWGHMAAAQTGKVVQCGVPTDITLETDPGKDYCDIYSRQLAYKEKRLEFRRLLEERQKNYAAPRIQAVEAYEQAVAQKYYPRPDDRTQASNPDTDAGDEPLFKALDEDMQ